MIDVLKCGSAAATERGDRTPGATKAILLATLAVTAVALAAFLAATRGEPVDARFAAYFLALLTLLFLGRVAGQILVRLRGPRWLPPTEQWNLMPYRYLLPSQLAILAIMLWIVVDLARKDGLLATPRPALGTAVVSFSFLYAAAMGVRYAVRMRRRPEQRWFGGTIPIVFHVVLASFLFVFGTYHASH